MQQADLQLYVDDKYLSPYAMSVFVALKEKGLHFGMTALDLAAGASRTEEYAALSLTRRVPALVHKGFALSESSAICEYLDENLSGPLLYPADNQARARARQVQAWLRSDLMRIREERPTEVIFYRPREAALSEAARQDAERLFYAAEALLPANEENLFGHWSIADSDLALMLNRLVLNGDPVPRKLAAYAARQWQRPSVQAWVALPRPPR